MTKHLTLPYNFLYYISIHFFIVTLKGKRGKCRVALTTRLLILGFWLLTGGWRDESGRRPRRNYQPGTHRLSEACIYRLCIRLSTSLLLLHCTWCGSGSWEGCLLRFPKQHVSKMAKQAILWLVLNKTRLKMGGIHSARYLTFNTEGVREFWV